MRRYKAPKTFATEDEAKTWLRGVHRAIKDGLWTAPTVGKTPKAGLTLKEYSDDWLKHRLVRGRPLKQRTREHYEDLLEDHIYPELGPLPIRSITRDDIEAWYKKTLVDHPTYRSHAYSLLRTILGTAEDEERIPMNPVRIRGAGSVEPAHEAPPATLEELAVIVSKMPARLQLMVELAAWCALRFGELTELRRENVVVAKDRITLNIRLGAVRTKDGRKAETTKSRAGVRPVTVPPHLRDAVKEHLQTHTGKKKSDLLFPAKHGGYLAPSTLYRHYYKGRSAAGRPDLHFHDLRVTGATMAAVAGATLKELQARLGHSTVAAAMRYQRVAQDRDADLAKKLSELVDVRTTD
ncbi:tyrosine-type recombinase/integrase [Nocardia arthritidis]|nr:site-specific integrase [Nocardia arthritidis]